MRALILLLLVFISGCYTPLVSLEEWNKDKDISVREAIREIFTPEAYELIKDIPVYRGPLPGHALASGTTVLSRVPLLFSGITGRAVVLREKDISNVHTTYRDMLDDLVHEYIHHLEDLSLDADVEFLDNTEFHTAYAACRNNTNHHGIYLFVEDSANTWVTNNFGISELSEYIAYTGQIIYKQRCTPSLRRVYSHILRKPPNVKDVE